MGIRNKDKRGAEKPKSLLRRTINAIALIVTVAISLGLLVSAYSGYISPADWRFEPLAVLSFAIWFLAIVFVLIIDLIWWRRTAIIAGIAMLICAPQIWNYCPLNLPSFSKYEGPKFTLMEYNVMQFMSQNPDSPFDSNQQLDYILQASPDIACIVEASCFLTNSKTKITQQQLQDINSMYRYIYIDGEFLGLLSKYETKPIYIGDRRDETKGGYSIGAWRMKIDGKILNLFVLHLQSFQLSTEDRNLFSELTNGERPNRAELREAKSSLLPKVEIATARREGQVEEIIEIINKYGGENAIVCGDFNDTSNSYALRRLQDECGLKQMYPQVGFGPMVTYNAHNFFFRIDHILYRGEMKPLELSRGALKASDHYPLNATFGF